MLASEAAMTKSYLTTSTGSKAKVHRRKHAIPVIKHIAKDNDQEKQEVLTKPIELSRVIHFLEDPLAATLKERQIFALKKVVKRCQKGFLLKELADVFKILYICAEKSKDHPEYTSVLCDLLKICRLPFLKEKTSDEVTYAQTVKESFSQMGFLMRVPNAEVRNQICHSIISVYSSVTSKHSVDGLHPTSLGYRVQLLEQSGLAETLVLSMALLENQPAVKLQVLQTLQMLSSSSDVNCSLILKAQGAQQICFHMNEPDPSGQVLFRSSEILWNLLERGCKEEVTAQLSNMDCIMALKEAFLHQLLNGFRHYDFQLRNDLLVITTLIAENPKSPLIESLFAKQLILFVTFPELKSHNPLVRNLKLSYNNEDFEMKRLLLNLVVVMSKDLSALQLFKEGHVVLALLHLVKPTAAPPEGQSGPRNWTPVQQEELQLQALATLATVAPLMLDDYMICQGNTCLLLLLEWCTERDAYFGQGHSFHGTGGRGSKKAQMRYCVRLLRSMASLGNEAINQDLFDQGAISQLLVIIMQMEGSPEEEDIITLEIKADIQLILSALCENNPHRKELFGSEGVEMTVHFLKMSTEKFYSGLGHNKLILSTVDCVWSCIVGCYTTEDVFLEKEGIFLLLDLLHSSPRNMQNVVLGTLLELCDNPKTMSHILAWRGQKSLTTPGLLLQLWRQEEAELGVSRDLYGRISDPKKPILCYYQEEDDSQVSLPANRPSAAVMDVSENLRSKIYSVFCKLGFEALPGLSTEDYITLSIVTRYLDFKVGEVWDEISKELSLEGVRPVTPDEEALDTIAKMTEDTARRVITQQSSMLEQRDKEDVSEEKRMYTEISSNWKQQELTAQSWEHFVAKTSNYKILKETKEHQERSIDSSRPKSKHKETIFHPTQIHGLQITNFCGRLMTVESTPAHLTGGPLANTELALERVPIQGGALRKLPTATEDPEYFNTVSVK
ncbi:cilia- and flagella-associated protein 69 isoform X2 [Oncorhynchus tshawytscha]|uniref:Cilia- and flagella-associated protein 69 ARM repeats domain-containing protein n=1 Tax=Oncorhynchus tshawytscha TaxID=74940 RepID=A0A8C8CJB3_ONCTS|nr:cilia- and flagella-associated protein 69 isoform X2 [Oncorhynchus tshawytscha]